MDIESSHSEYESSSEELSGDHEPDELDDKDNRLPYEMDSRRLPGTTLVEVEEIATRRVRRSATPNYIPGERSRELGSPSGEPHRPREAPSRPLLPNVSPTGRPQARNSNTQRGDKSARTIHDRLGGDNFASGDGPGHVHGPQDDEVKTLRRHVGELQTKLKEAQSVNRVPEAPAAIPSYRPQTIYRIFQDTRTSQAFLEEPHWVNNEYGIPELKARSPIRDIDRYLDEHPETAFVIYKDYDLKSYDDIESKETKDGIFKRVEPRHESLDLVADHMYEALTQFVSRVPFFDVMFPGLSLAKEIAAPYLFVYYSIDYVEDIRPNLRPFHATLVQLLMDTINKNYGTQYHKADEKAQQNLVTKTFMPYLVKPGSILVRFDGPNTQAYRATSWLGPCKTSGIDEPVEDLLNDWNDASRFSRQIRKQETRARRFRHSYAVTMWSYSFTGVYEAVYEEKAVIELVAISENDEVRIDSLNLFPLHYASDAVREMLKERGKMHWKCRHGRLVTHHHEVDSHLTNITDRYMIDVANCRKLFPKLFSPGGFRDDMGPSAMAQDEPPSKEDYFLFPATIVGYNLYSKRCRGLFVRKLRDVQWNKKAFEHLVIDHQSKELVQALVMHQLEAEETTDLISGKGRGLIMLLHGGPGTGKTFTAEGVAEFAEKPLLRVTCGDIGVEPRQVEKYLQRCFRLGKIWDCVVLLDEADVFLEERDIKDLNRNALVSVFLRVLEYYNGILVLTSNRVGTFDEAFKSRIQLALHYENLTEPRRRKIWRNFMDRLRDMDNTHIDFTDVIDHVEELGKANMNGREIRNVITTARQLAKYKGEKLAYVHLKHAIEVGSRFAKYLSDLNEGATDDQIKREGAIR